ncbi:putative NTE family protein [Fundidesulfovibrio magnetotacticus]|uniref:Putative NTE family protein n=1 Tax=Fundidesulfovibrio magnetotacticus TaxID=2730080 RepID=A0A6V8LS37_9BACT|nr:cyclic nucleotide-binding domain-containing protein [Fundidesulfovibrio magnetotacticus]GFK93790.1 putative NTE family protein [Fundidesulfovibrio magnetotacticus]
MSSSTETKPDTSSCAYADYLEVLRELPLFGGVPLDVCKVLAYLSVAETHQPGDYLIRQGETADAFHYLSCGRVEVMRQTGGEAVVLKTLEQGDSLGGLALILGGRANFSVRAVEETVSMALTRDKFLKTVKRFPELEPALLQALAAHVLDWEERFMTRRPDAVQAMGGDLGLTLF